MPGNAAEIGVAEGLFSADILSWRVSFPKVYMVDRWRCVASQKGDASNSQAWHEANYKAAQERVARVAQYGDRAVLLRGSSGDMAEQVPNESLSLLYIDGDHSYEGVIFDLITWVSKVKQGGVVALHDYENPSYGVKRAVQAYCKVNRLEVHLLSEDKMEDAGAYFIVC